MMNPMLAAPGGTTHPQQHLQADSLMQFHTGFAYNLNLFYSLCACSL